MFNQVLDDVGDITLQKTLTLDELHIYGSSRHGIKRPKTRLIAKTYELDEIESDGEFAYNNATDSAILSVNYHYFKRTLSYKQYELTNHLGNVLDTIMDRKTAHISSGNVDYYEADVATAQHYYAFGSAIKELTYAHAFSGDTSKYRYGFNGEELENNIDGDGMVYDLGARFYDARLGRMFSLDPLMAKYAWQSPYTYCHNSPLLIVDINGMGDDPIVHKVKKNETLWGVAHGYYKEHKQELGMTWEAYWESVKAWNKGGDYGKIDGKMYLSDPQAKNKAIQKRNEEILKRNKAIREFASYPPVLASTNPSMTPSYIPPKYLQDGSYRWNVSHLNVLFDASLTGVELVIIKGSLLESLKSSIQDFNGPTGSDPFDQIVSGFKQSGLDYYSGTMLVRFGPVDKTGAATETATWVMRNATMKYWIEKTADNQFIIYVHVFDYYNVKPEGYKDGSYNSWAKFLNGVHHVSGGNANMQVRAEWTVIRK